MCDGSRVSRVPCPHGPAPGRLRLAGFRVARGLRRVGGTQQAIRAEDAWDLPNAESLGRCTGAARRGFRARAVRGPVRAPGGGFQTQLPWWRPPEGGKLVRAPELEPWGPPLTPAAGWGGAAADPAHPAAAREPGRNEQRGPSGRRRSADNGSGAGGRGRGAPGPAGTGGRAMSLAAGRPPVRRAGRGERPLRVPGPTLGPAMRCRGRG